MVRSLAVAALERKSVRVVGRVLARKRNKKFPPLQLPAAQGLALENRLPGLPRDFRVIGDFVILGEGCSSEEYI